MNLNPSGPEPVGNKHPWTELVRDKASRSGLTLSRQQIDQFSHYAKELIKWSHKINLTAIDEPDAIVVKHFLDSLAAANFLGGSERLLDIGTGAGFPSVPLKLYHPSLSVTAIDGSRKKINFVAHLIRTLALDNITALQMRSEQLRMVEKHLSGYDVVVCRALSDLASFFQQAIEFVRPGGRLLAWKGARAGEEIKAFWDAAGNNKRIDRYQLHVCEIGYALPGYEEKRCLVSIQVHR